MLRISLWVIFWLCIVTLNSHATELSVRFERLWPKLPQPWYFKAPGAIALGADGSVFIADTGNYQVQKFTVNGDFVQKWGAQGSDSGSFGAISAIATAADGSVLVADALNNRIQQFTADGRFIRAWGATGTGPGQFDTPSALAVSSTGLVYVADTGNQRIQIFNLQGVWQQEWRGAQNLAFNRPSSLSISPTNEVYIGDAGNERIVVFSATGDVLRSWKTGAHPDPFSGKSQDIKGMAYAALDNILYVVYSDYYLQQYSPEGKDLGVWGQYGYQNGQFAGPLGIAITPSGRIYTTERDASRIQVFDRQKNPLQQWQSFGFDKDKFWGPQGIAADAAGNFYVADREGQIVKMLDAEGKFIKSFEQPNSNSCVGYGPQGIALASNGQFYVTDAFANCVHQFSAEGKYLKSWGGKGSEAGKFQSPSGITVAANGQVWVVDSGNHRVQVFSSNGEFLSSLGSLATQEADAGKFIAPEGIAISPSGLVVVSDGEGNAANGEYIRSHRIQVFSAQGQYLGQFGGPGDAAGQFIFPAYLAFSSDGKLLVTDAGGEAFPNNNRVQIFAFENNTFVPIGKIGMKGTSEGFFNRPLGIASKNGKIWVVDSGNNRVQKFSLGAEQTSPQTLKHPWKAVVLAGGGPSTENYTNLLWDSTQVLANKAYITLRAQGFQKDEIQFLTAGDLKVDIDNDGRYNDLQAANLQNLEASITTWAADANSVVLYLINHGGPGTFEVNSKEILNKEQLSGWVKSLQSKIPGKITVIIEACKSAGFFPGFSPNTAKPASLIASSSAEQPAVISNQGLNSFSYYFWSEILSGSPVQAAFTIARQAMSAQSVVVNNKLQRQAAQLDTNGDSEFTEVDTQGAAYCFGNCVTTAAQVPEIVDKTADTVLQGETKLQLKMQVKSLDPILNAWVLFNRPDKRHNDTNQPVSELEKTALVCSLSNPGNYLCQGEYSRFDVQGIYNGTLYAQDIESRVSMPRAISITQASGKAVPPAPAETRYLPESGELILEDVTVNGLHYAARLKDQGGFNFLLQDAKLLTISVESPAARYDTATQQLYLPKILANGQYYQAQLATQNASLFSVTEVRAR